MRDPIIQNQKNNPLQPKRRWYSSFFTSVLLMTSILAVFSGGCKKVTEEPGLVGICPVVVSTDPNSGAINVVTTKKISATFNEAIDPSTMNVSTFLLKQGANPVLGTVTYTGNIATFTPTNPLAANTVYTATITSGVKDPAKNALPIPYVWSFNTGAIPIVVSTDPINGASDVVFNKVIAATFSTGMDPLSINSTNYFIKQGTNIVPGVVTYAGLVASFTPTLPLTPNTVYTGTVTSGAKDIAGNAMASNYTWSFSTGILPIVVSTDPADAAINIVLNKVVTAIFSKNMDATTINTTTISFKQGTTAVPGTVTYSGKTATFTPISIFAINTVYTGTITTGVKDSAGNAMAANYTWNFTTGNAPVVISTDPANGDLNVPLNKTITASFSTAMNPASIGASSFIVKQGTTVIPGTVSYAGTTASFKPTNPLIVNTAYTATITTGAKDALGNAMTANYNWGFNTNNIPAVLSTDPIPGASNVVLNKTVAATFNKVMDPLSINATTFLLKQGTNTVLGTVSYTASTASFAPLSPLAANTVYTATITTGAKDPSGNALAADYTWSFTTSSIPSVISTNPANGDINVPFSQIITAGFSKAMDPATMNVLNFMVKQGTTPVFGTVSYSGTVASFTPASFLADNTVYTATITTGAKDPTGNSIAANYVWSFTTLKSTPPPSILGSASIFGSMGGNAGVTNQGLFTVINNGSIGTTAASTLITGFHDGITGDIYTETPLNKGLVSGRIYTAAPAPGTAASFTIAQQGLADANLAYLSISPASKPGGTDPGAGELGGLTLAPGVYKSSGATFNIFNGDLVLDAKGDPNATWIFQCAGGLTVGTAGPAGARSVTIINGGNANNVYWYVGSKAVINGAGGGTMTGNIIATAGVTFSTAGNVVQTVLNGRAISLVASVTMVNTTINVPN